jgi:hypothetical protein
VAGVNECENLFMCSLSCDLSPLWSWGNLNIVIVWLESVPGRIYNDLGLCHWFALLEGHVLLCWAPDDHEKKYDLCRQFLPEVCKAWPSARLSTSSFLVLRSRTSMIMSMEQVTIAASWRKCISRCSFVRECILTPWFQGTRGEHGYKYATAN